MKYICSNVCLGVKNEIYDCMYHISQIIAQNSQNFLSEAMKRKTFDAGCLQWSLAVMQKGQTFNNLYKLLQNIDKFGDIIVQKQMLV